MSPLASIKRLPDTWQTKPLRHVVDYAVSNVDKHSTEGELPIRLCNYTDVYNNESITAQLDFMSATASASEIERFSIDVDDVIITKDSESHDDIGVPALVRETAENLVCGYHLALLRPRKQEIEGPYLFRCLQAKPIRAQIELAANGITRFGVAKSEIGKVMLPVPPLVEQHAIVKYLDRETDRLDALVAAKERVLVLLSEKRQTVVAHAVTRGLDSRVTLRDSGVPWLGEIPSSWRTQRAAQLFRERDERGEPDLPLLEVSIGDGVVAREFSSERIETTAADFNTYKIARQGDIVFNKMRMWQGAVGVSPQDGLVSPDYVVATPTGPLSPAYVGLLFRIGSFSAECARHSHGIVWDRLRLYWAGFREIELPVPPAETQLQIVEHAFDAEARLDALAVAVERTISLLRERRAALIGAAVNGNVQLDSFE